MVALTGTEAGLRLDLDRFLLDLRGLAAELGAEQPLGIPDLKCARINLWWDCRRTSHFLLKVQNPFPPADISYLRLCLRKNSRTASVGTAADVADFSAGPDITSVFVTPTPMSRMPPLMPLLSLLLRSRLVFW